MTLPPRSGDRDGPGGLTERLFHLGGELAYIVTLSFVWLLLSIPLVTIPAATAAVYGTIGAHIVDGGREYVAPFREAFTGSLRRVTLPGLGLLAVIALTSFNTFYYLRGVEYSALKTSLGVVQIALGAAAVIVVGLYLLLVGLHYARGHVGRPPTFKETSSVALRHPAAALGILAISAGIPAAVGVLYLWQFAVFIIGAVCYANVWALMRMGVPELMPER